MFQTARNLCTPVPFLSSCNSHFFFCLFSLFLSSFHFFLFPLFSLLFLPILPFFLHSVPFFSSFSLLLCFHFHSVPTNSPFVRRTVAWLFNESHIFHVGGKSSSNSKVYEIPGRYILLCFATRVLSNLLSARHTFRVLVTSSKIRNSLHQIEHERRDNSSFAASIKLV